MKLIASDKKLLAITLILAGIFCGLLAFGYMMGDPEPGVKFDRTPAVWLPMLALVAWGIAGWLLYERPRDK